MQVAADRRWIDKLVDDELTPEERHALIALLETEPNAWRMVGLAFLEAQAWRGGAFDLASAARNPGPTASAPKPRAAVRFAFRPSFLAAACFWLVAFGLGFATSRALPVPANSAELARDSAADGNKPPAESSKPVGTESPRRIGRIELTSAQSGELPVADVPLYEGGIPPEWNGPPPSIPDEVRTVLERRGYQLERTREFLAVPLADGRQAVVPVDDVQVKYVGQPVY